MFVHITLVLTLRCLLWQLGQLPLI